MKYVISLSLILLLSACGGGPLSFLTGGGPKVAANVQAGQENNQTGAQVGDIIKADTVNTGVTPSGTIDSLNVINEDIPMWVILLLILGWVLPSPQEIWRGFLKTITMGKYRG
jgi:hypothetical protein